ncbi:MAG: sugar ABC transporter ATP-binding protein [Treponema sp.]|jgi:ABC-type sugar transport system ATPase subunit|nr:sugar ABC transporter ATP-binding protein [Treponema sp.]
MEKSCLTIRHITKKFPGTVALSDVSFDLRPREILAILGENGAGKSTLMKILSGSYPHGSYSGEILDRNGTPLVFRDNAAAEKAGIGMIYQEKNLMLDLSVAENIFIGHMPKNALGMNDWNRAKVLARDEMAKLAVTNLDVTINVRYLNASMQQLVCIARALVKNPNILILDEPTSCLTERETALLVEILRGLKERGISCFYISHKLDEILNLCDRCVILRDGQMVSEYERDDFNAAKIIEDIVGRRIDTVYERPPKRIGGGVLRVEGAKVAHPYAYGKNIIEDVSFDLRKGEVLGLAGLVGSGRSELLSAIFGAKPLLAGSVYINGKKAVIGQPSDAKKLGIGFLTEDRKTDGYIHSLNIRENMALTILKSLVRTLFIDRKKELSLTGGMFNQLRIKAPGLNTGIMSLSGGNQQKVLIGKWLLTNMEILFLDEPTRGIDVGTKAEIYKMIGELAAQGMAIVVISSELPELLGICDRFLVLSKGRIVKELGRSEADEGRILHYASNLDNAGNDN